MKVFVILWLFNYLNFLSEDSYEQSTAITHTFSFLLKLADKTNSMQKFNATIILLLNNI